MNNVEFKALPDTDQVKVTIRSEGERDLSAVMPMAEFQMIAKAMEPPREETP